MIPHDTTPDHGLLVQRAHAARAEAQRQQEWSARLSGTTRTELGYTLTRLTDELDWRRSVSPTRAERLARLSRMIGRDASIEQAKMLLRDRYQITGAQAFELLRHMSQNSNRKLRDVARDVLAG